MADATIVIVARNAGRTVERAIRSAQAQGDSPILLVDDQSTDATASIAAAVRGVRVERLPEHRTLGHARQKAVELVDTEFAVLLDADDELMPGRTTRLVAAMRAEGTQMAFDGAEVHDGLSGALVREAPVPAFMLGRRVAARLFERNYLPIIGPAGFRTAWLRSIGYDSAMHGAEDLDVVLRGTLAGGECSLVADPGYRLYAYPSSLSRQRDNQRTMLQRSLQKHSYDIVEQIYTKAGYRGRIIRWGLVSFALFRGDFGVAAARLRELEREALAPSAILEPDGPYPYPEGWRMDFHAGTVSLLQGCAELAAERLTAAEHRRPTAEGANNLGVASFALGQAQASRAWFAAALDRFPGYHDARQNAQAPVPAHITSHPFRRTPSRDDCGAVIG